jgi:hypothetical protein
MGFSVDVDHLPSSELEYLPSSELEYLPSSEREYLPSSELEYLPSSEQPIPPLNTFVRTSLPNTIKLYSSLRVKKQVSHPYKIADNIIVLYI